jgi:hypothetical protein
MMTRREWIVAGSFLLLLWLAAAAWLAPRLQDRLNTDAAAWLKTLDARAGGARFDHVQVTFDGQSATLHGTVRHESDAQQLIRELGTTLRTPGNPWNPVTQVKARPTLDVRPLDSGWLVAAVRGLDAEITGVCASEAEREALEAGLHRRWPTWRGQINFAIRVDPRRFDESAAWIKTVQSLPAPEARGQKAARLLAARIGDAWRDVDGTPDGDQFPPNLAALGVSGVDWQERLRARAAEVHAHRVAEAAWEAEQERLRRLPPPHVFLGQRADQVLIRGEVFDLEAKRAVLSAVMAALPDKRLLDDLRAKGERRPGLGLGALDSASLSESPDGKRFALGLPGQTWTSLDWQTGRDAQPWKDHLPPGLTPELVQPDSALVIDWLQGANAGIPTLPAPPPPPFVTLAAFAGRVVIGGRLAEESLRAQLVEAVKRAYPAGWDLRDEVAVSGACAASESIQHTVQSIPVAEPDTPRLAVAIPGQSWQDLPLALLVDPARLDDNPLPEGLPPQTVVASFQNVVAEMRALGLPLPEPPTPAPKAAAKTP